MIQRGGKAVSFVFLWWHTRFWHKPVAQWDGPTEPGAIVVGLERKRKPNEIMTLVVIEMIMKSAFFPRYHWLRTTCANCASVLTRRQLLTAYEFIGPLVACKRKSFSHTSADCKVRDYEIVGISLTTNRYYVLYWRNMYIYIYSVDRFLVSMPCPSITISMQLGDLLCKSANIPTAIDHQRRAQKECSV